MTNPLKSVYFDVLGRQVAKIEVHINNGNDVSLVVRGSFALNSHEDACAFFNTIDFNAHGLSSTAMMYSGDERNAPQYAGSIFRSRDGSYGINLLVIDKEKLLNSSIPVYGWDGQKVA